MCFISSFCLQVDHVILFDFPSNAIDFLHRVGRTARAGATGRFTAFITKKDRALAEFIQVKDSFSL